MIKEINNNIIRINRSPYFLAMMILIMSLGSKYLDIKFGFTISNLLNSEWTKILILFAIIWTTTRDIYISILTTSVFILLFEYLLHEESNLCIIPQKYRIYNMNKPDINNNYKINEKEIDNAINVLNKAKYNSNCTKKINTFEKFRYFTNI
jgi:hypothetical protein